MWMQYLAAGVVLAVMVWRLVANWFDRPSATGTSRSDSTTRDCGGRDDVRAQRDGRKVRHVPGAPTGHQR